MRPRAREAASRRISRVTSGVGSQRSFCRLAHTIFVGCANMSSTARLPTYSKELLLNSPTPVKLPIAERVVHEVLLSQRRAADEQQRAGRSSRRATPAERQRLTLAIARGPAVVHGGGRGDRLAPPRRGRGGGGSARPRWRRSLKPEAVRELLLAQPRREMGAAELRARFAPSTAAERKQLAVAIAEWRRCCRRRPSGPAVVRLRRERPPLTERGANVAAAAAAGDEHAPATVVERELLTKLIEGCPGGRIRGDELLRTLAPSGEGARRRLAHVIAKLARTVIEPDGAGGAATSSCCATTAPPPPPAAAPPRRRRAGRAAAAAAPAADGGGGGGGAAARAGGSAALIAAVGPLDSEGEQALAAATSRAARVVLPDGVGGAATVVLRDVAVRDATRARRAAAAARLARGRRGARARSPRPPPRRRRGSAPRAAARPAVADLRAERARRRRAD